MGRRPNPIISEHFQRGEKLVNASNRYSYSCRNCGEAFPKGRADSLISHVTQYCPKIGADERQHALQSMQQHSSPSPKAHRKSSAATDADRRTGPFMVEQASDSSREPSALDTLAEVSRRHLDFSLHDQTTTDHALIQELRKAANMPDSPRSSSAADSFVECSAPLVQTASRANERLERGESKASAQTSSALDPRLDAGEQDVIASASKLSRHGSLANPHVPDDRFSGNGHRGVPLEHMTAGYTATTKTRGRFSDTRRKQVSEIRKRGACIRCRMLKKPCSEGTPCLTCKSVESARLWKTSCIRTRLADEFALWSAGLFYAKARIDVPAAVQGREQSQHAGSIEVRLWETSSTHASFLAQKYSTSLVGYRSTMIEPPQSVDPALQPASSPQSKPSATEDVVLLSDSDSLSTKIEEYIRSAVLDRFVREPAALIRSTLERARVLVQLEDTQATSHVGGQSSRSSYSLQDQLLKNVLELWTGTEILSSHKEIEASIQCRPTTPQALGMNSTEDVVMGGIHDEGTQHITAQSRDLVTAQLLAATESRCAALAKTVVNEIERRLLQRQQVSRESTLMSAIILLNCVERMTGLYWSMDPDPSSTEEPKMPPAWPLDTPPRKLWLQGEHFADMLIMLLRMRGLPPKIATTQNGYLVVVPDQPIRHKNDNRRTTGQAEDQAGIPAEWLDSLELKADDLLRIRDSGVRDQKVGARAFDLAFISRVLLQPSR